jgi:hypothetical protein
MIAAARVYRGRDFDGAYRTSPEQLANVKRRHAELRRLGLCINGPREAGAPGRRAGIVHGPANPISGKCDHCETVARRSR